MPAAAVRERADQRWRQESFSDYHLYTVWTEDLINNSQTTQVSMSRAPACR